MRKVIQNRKQNVAPAFSPTEQYRRSQLARDEHAKLQKDTTSHFHELISGVRYGSSRENLSFITVSRA